MYRGEVCPFRNSRDSPLPLVPKGFLSVPPGLGSYFLCSYLGRDRRGSRTGRQKQTHRQRQAGQADGAEREPHLQEPASSTSVWDTDAREAERRVAGAAEGRGQRERVTSSPPSAGMASRHSSNLPTQPSRGRPSFLPSIHRPRLTEACAGATPSAGAAGDALWAASCSVFSCSRRMVWGAGRGQCSSHWVILAPTSPPWPKPHLPCPPRKGACAPSWPGPRDQAVSLSTQRRRQP